MPLADAKKIFIDAFKDAIKPPPIITVSEWSDQNRMLPSKTSSEPGKWRTERTPYLREIMDELSHMSRTKEVVFMKGAQVGAALSHCTNIPTPYGWTNMGDISVGDKVFDEKGNICKVKFKSETFTDHKCYEILFSDNSKVIADASHRWKVIDLKSKSKNNSKIVTTQYMVDSGVMFREDRSRWCISVADPIKTSHKKLPIDPWILGYWLGDGHSYQRSVTCHAKDQDELMSIFNFSGSETEIVHEKKYKGLARSFRFGSKDEMRKFKDVDVFKNKHIPEIYLRSSVNQRISLLQGLMDSGGSISNNRREFSTRSDKILSGVTKLLSSLGIKYSVYSVLEKKKYDKSGDEVTTTHRVSFTTFKIDCFRLRRKHYMQKEKGRKLETERRYIKSIKKIKTVDVSCIEVDSLSHMFLCGDNMIPTHNTESGNNWLGYIIDYMPATVMVVWPALPDVKKNSKLRIDPLIEHTPCLAGKISSGKNKDKSNTTMFKDFDGGAIILSGANSASSLRSVPAKFLFLDEIDGYPDDVEGEGDPIALVQARARTFSRRKIYKVSTPTIKGRSKIERAFKKSDQRYFHLPCPHCKEFQKLNFKNLEYDTITADEGKVVTGAAYFCSHCGEEIHEHHKTFMLSNGMWIKESPESKIAGFHLSALYSPLGWYSWKEIAQDWVDAQGNFEMLMAFHNTVLGETYEDHGDKPEHEKLYQRRELYDIGTVPRGVLFLTCAVDVQKDRLEAEVIGWGRFKERWSIDHKVIPGNVQDQLTWDNLEDYIQTTFPHDDGYQVSIKMTGIDSGYETQRVYNFCRKFNPRAVIALKGEMSLPQIVGIPKAVDVKNNGKVNRRGLKLWRVGTNHAKSELYGDLKLDAPLDIIDSHPPGFIHFPQYDMEYFLQLTAEERTIEKDKKGFSKIIWKKKRDRNEILDLHVYNRAVASIIGIDRMNETHYTKLESNIGVATQLKKLDTENKTRTEKNNRRKKKGSTWL